MIIPGLKETILFGELTRQEFDDLMVQTFPVIFKDRHRSLMETAMCWGFDIGPGWYELLYKLCIQLDFIMKETGIDITTSQIKEKFGSLRVYYYWSFPEDMPEGNKDYWYSIIEDLVDLSEYQSEHTCENCGEWGKIRDNGWLACRCVKCAKKDGYPVDDPEWRLI